jgi:hypothetical protein
MARRQIAIFGGSLLLAIAAHAVSANALSMQECSAKYKAAKEAGMKWNDFRKGVLLISTPTCTATSLLDLPSPRVGGLLPQTRLCLGASDTLTLCWLCR